MINFFTVLFTIISLNTVENLNNFEGVDSKTASNLLYGTKTPKRNVP